MDARIVGGVILRIGQQFQHPVENLVRKRFIKVEVAVWPRANLYRTDRCAEVVQNNSTGALLGRKHEDSLAGNNRKVNNQNVSPGKYRNSELRHLFFYSAVGGKVREMIGSRPY